MIIVDVTVANCEIRAARPDIQSPMPNTDSEKIAWWDSVSLERLNKRTWGHLKGRALQKAKRIVDKNGSISTSGEYGSIEVDEREFIAMESEK